MKIEVYQVGNTKSLLKALKSIDAQSEKIDLDQEIRDIHLHKMLDAEKATFEIFNLDSTELIKEIKSDMLLAETRYSAKQDLIDIFNFSKFANFCRDKEYEDLIESIKEYLVKKNSKNTNPIKLRLVREIKENKYYIRALTSTQGYKDFGINFSVFVAIVSLGRYVTKSKSEVLVDYFSVTESEIYVSFRISKEIKLDKNLKLAISLVLENDEIKRSSVSFNGVCRLTYIDKDKESEIIIKPKGLKKEGKEYKVDLLTYPHRGSVEKVYDRIQELPVIIEEFIKQVSEDSKRISKLKSPDDVRKYLALKVKYSKKKEFQEYKDRIFKKLMKISVINTFNLFELIREVEDLFDHDDIVSRDFWRTKLYEVLIEKE